MVPLWSASVASLLAFQPAISAAALCAVELGLSLGITASVFCRYLVMRLFNSRTSSGFSAARFFVSLRSVFRS